MTEGLRWGDIFGQQMQCSSALVVRESRNKRRHYRVGGGPTIWRACAVSLTNHRHSRESGNPKSFRRTVIAPKTWVPACARTTVWVVEPSPVTRFAAQAPPSANTPSFPGRRRSDDSEPKVPERSPSPERLWIPNRRTAACAGMTVENSNPLPSLSKCRIAMLFDPPLNPPAPQ